MFFLRYCRNAVFEKIGVGVTGILKVYRLGDCMGFDWATARVGDCKDWATARVGDRKGRPYRRGWTQNRFSKPFCPLLYSRYPPTRSRRFVIGAFLPNTDLQSVRGGKRRSLPCYPPSALKKSIVFHFFSAIRKI